MKNDYIRPNISDVWDRNVDYIMFIDENNSVNAINNVQKKMLIGEEVNPNENIFTVTGCIFSKKDYFYAKQEFEKLRKKYWKNMQYFNTKHNQFETVCFHTEDIKGRKKAFHRDVLNDKQYMDFIIDLDNILKKCNYRIISININLRDYILKSHYTETNVYKIAFNFIIERFIYNIGNHNVGNIIFEARGKKEDKNLLEHVDKIINFTGTEFISSAELQQKIKGVYFNKKKNKKGHPYTGLEIADLSSYPIHRYVKFGTIGKDFETIRLKFVGYPNIFGKGLKIYPKKIEADFVSTSTDHECDP